MNWKLVRFLSLWAAGVWLALLQYHPRTPPAHRPTPTEKWMAAHPRRTAGCPALHPQLAAWQQSLALTDWQIEIVCGLDPVPEGLIGWTRPDPKTRTAKIAIRDGLSRGWQQSVIVHELLHVGAADGRWPAPRGHRPQEGYVEAMADRVYLDRSRDVNRQMLESARGTAVAATAAPEAADEQSAARAWIGATSPSSTGFGTR